MAIAEASDLRNLLGLETTDDEQVQVLVMRGAEGAVKRFLGYDPEQRERTEYYPQQDRGAQGGSPAVWRSTATQAYLERAGAASAEVLQLLHIPVRESITVSEDTNGRFDTVAGAFATNLTAGDDFYLRHDRRDSAAGNTKVSMDGQVIRVGRWPTEPGSIKVVYTAGYDANELNGLDTILDASPIQQATLMLAAAKFKMWKANQKTATGLHLPGAPTSERLGDYQYTVGGGAQLMTSMLLDMPPAVEQMLWPFRHLGLDNQ